MNVDSEKLSQIYNYCRGTRIFYRESFRRKLFKLYLFLRSFKFFSLSLAVVGSFALLSPLLASAAIVHEIPFTSDSLAYTLGTGTPGLQRQHALAGFTFPNSIQPIKSFLYTGLLKRVGNPIDSLQLKIYQFSSVSAATSSPNGGTLIATASILGSALPSSDTADIGFTFDHNFRFVGTSTYSLVFSRTGSASTTNYYQITNVSNAWQSAWAMSDDYGGSWVQNGTTKRFSGAFFSANPQTDALATSAQAFANAWNSYTSSTWNCTNSTSTSGQGFVDALSCAAKSTAYEILSFMFVPHSFVTNIFTNAFQILSTGFPFNLFFESVDEMQSQINSGDFSTQQSLGFTVSVPGGSATSSISITSTTFSNTLGQQFMNGVFELQKYLAWVFFAWLAYKLVFR